MSQLTNDKDLNSAATLAPTLTTRRTVRGCVTLAGTAVLGAALTLSLFAGRAEAGMKVHNGLFSQNGMKVHNGLFSQNGMKVHNGLFSQNGMKVHNGLFSQNGMKVHNGLFSQNGMKIPNGLGIHKGMRVHTVTVTGAWVARTIDPRAPLAAAAKARR